MTKAGQCSKSETARPKELRFRLKNPPTPNVVRHSFVIRDLLRNSGLKQKKRAAGAARF